MRLCALIALCLNTVLLAKIPKNLESLYTKSTIAVKEQKWEEALTNLNAILKQSPQLREALELKAVALTSLGQANEAKTIYSTLINLPSDNSNTTRKGFYAFELGKIAYKQKKLEEAKAFLLDAIKNNHNLESSHFLLGKIYWDQNNWDESRKHFKSAAQGEQFRALSELYIAQTLKFESQGQEASEHYNEAKIAAHAELDSGYATTDPARNLRQEVIKLSESELTLSSQSPWIKEIAIATGYDSNVLFSPNAGDSTNTNAEGSVKQALNWKLQYSPLRKSQVSYRAQYQGAMNYNFNKETQGGQFFLHDIANFISLGSLKSQHYGFKIAGTGAMQFRENTFKPFLLSGSFGPFARVALNDKWWVGAETFFQPVKVYQDNLISSGAKRSGWDQTARLSLTPQNPQGLWAPSFYLGGTRLRIEVQSFFL